MQRFGFVRQLSIRSVVKSSFGALSMKKSVVLYGLRLLYLLMTLVHVFFYSILLYVIVLYCSYGYAPGNLFCCYIFGVFFLSMSS